MTVEEAHMTILETAATLASGYASDLLPYSDGDIFRPYVLGSQTKLRLQYAPEVLNGMTQQQRVDTHARLRLIAKRAVAEALVEHGELFVGIILGYAKQGHNYFPSNDVST